MTILQKIILSLLVIATAHITYAANATLLPPWIILQNQLKAALNADPCVKVGTLHGDGRDMEVRVAVCNYDKAQALAAFANRTHEFGNLAVTVKVISGDDVPVYANAPQSSEEAAELLNQALAGNRYFVKAGMGDGAKTGLAYAEFKAEIVQYYSDDIGDWYLNGNEVAAKMFRDLLGLNAFGDEKAKVYATTALIK